MDFKEEMQPLFTPAAEKKGSNYAFFATDYDIRNLANKITATNKAKINMLNLKRGGGNMSV